MFTSSEQVKHKRLSSQRESFEEFQNNSSLDPYEEMSFEDQSPKKKRKRSVSVSPRKK